MYPLERNLILIRLENLADKFNNLRNGSTPEANINLKAYLKNLWEKANEKNDAEFKELKIEERSLSGQ